MGDAQQLLICIASDGGQVKQCGSKEQKVSASNTLSDVVSKRFAGASPGWTCNQYLCKSKQLVTIQPKPLMVTIRIYKC